MGKIIKISVLIFIVFIINGCGNKITKINLPNNYQIRSDKNMITKIGYVKNDKFYLELEGKKVGIDDYIAEYQYSPNYIGLKCVVKNTLEVIYYIIDSNNRDVYGPYKDYDTYMSCLKTITNNDKFNNFISVLPSNKS